MKNFDYILQVAEHVPGFKRLHEYCDMAESLQTTFPEDHDSQQQPPKDQ